MINMGLAGRYNNNMEIGGDDNDLATVILKPLGGDTTKYFANLALGGEVEICVARFKSNILSLY